MNVHEKAIFISKTLDRLFPKPQIPLSHGDPYTLLIAVMLSAQCTDFVVNKVTKELFSLADNPRAMSLLSEGQIAEIVRPCGLVNHKAKAILATSKLLLENFHGRVPETFEELESLPGVGHKTASVVMAQAFHRAAFPVDTHIARLSLRWGLAESANVRKIEERLKQIFPVEIWHDLHIQMIEYGRKYCPAKHHMIQNCPICLKILLDQVSL
ncbi:MAG: endonuclease III [Puniceicoccales bacterium]|jgi:endonuclease-3|nr:endonuclease III [Puniceicoccales bacterium]